jgi:hypothetical protein
MRAARLVYGTFDSSPIFVDFLQWSPTRFGRFDGEWMPFYHHVGRFDNGEGFARDSVIGSFAS